MSHLTEKTPEIHSYKIDEVLKPIDMTIGENYLCVLHDEEKSNEQIFVFDSENLEFKYKFSKRGSGPQETIALDMAKNMLGDTLYLIDQAKRKIISYKLEENKPAYLNEGIINLPIEKGPIQEVYMINDSVMIGNFLDRDLIVYDITNEKIIDTLNISYSIKGIDDAERTTLANFNFSYEENCAFIGMRLFDKVFKIELDSVFKFKNHNPVSLDNTVFNHSDYYDLINHHAFIHANGQYVLTQYYGRNLKSMQPFPINLKGQNLKCDFIIFDKDMTPLSYFHMDNDILRAFLDGERKRIYYLEANEDFDKLNYIQF